MKKEKGTNHSKIVFICLTIVIIIILLLFINFFTGNFIFKSITKNSSKNYINEKYGNMNLVIDRVFWDFKEQNYIVNVKSETSKDTHFILNYNAFGKLIKDSYDYDVLNRCNVAERLTIDYLDIVKRYFENSGLSYYDSVLVDIPCDNTLELDQNNLMEVAKKTGKVYLSLKSNNNSVSRIKDILLDVKKNLDNNNIKFNSISLINAGINEFLYSDIYENDLESRIGNNTNK